MEKAKQVFDPKSGTWVKVTTAPAPTSTEPKLYTGLYL